MRPLWKGSIGFGLVNIPVRLYSATEESDLAFVSLDKKSGSRIRYKKVADSSGKEVPQADIIKGYKMGEGYVIMEEADFDKALPEKKDHIDIVQFVSDKEIDVIYYEKPYYLEPEKGGDRAYALLREALKKEGKAAIGLFVFHNKEWVCLLKPLDKALVLTRLRYAEEIRSTNTLSIPENTIKADQLKMAASLINQLTKPFKPEAFKDEYSEKLLKVIEAKGKGKAAKYKEMKVVHSTKAEDLMEKLKASLKTSSKKAS
ncbi:MAG TPA: Ku protein [Flavisolibacter sp.]|nr:Ku protein [Flavisolibacter sp.]